MRKVTTVAGLAAFAGAIAAAAKAVEAASHGSPLTNRLNRSMRVWKLSARNTARFALTKVRGVGSPAQRRAELDEQFAIKTAEDVAAELGQMKGALMKAGQLVSFIIEALPDEAQQALSSLQADAEPMAPTLAAQMVRAELGNAPERVFLDWQDMPAAAASIGQVHKAVIPSGADVAVKVQYPGVSEAIETDLDAVQAMYMAFSTMMLKGLDVDGMTNELRDRMVEELDYTREARNLQEFATIFAGHPWARIPTLVPEFSTGRILTTEWVEGLSFDQFLAEASAETKNRAGEVIWRFAQHAITDHRAFNGDPHPGNYKFHRDGSVTFLDFGLVKRWEDGEWDRLRPSLEAMVVHRDPDILVGTMMANGFLPHDHGLDHQAVYDYVSSPYQPYLVDEFTFTRDWMVDTMATLFDVQGPHADVIATLNMPGSFVILDRVVWGVSAILGKLGASGPYRAMLLEYLADQPPATELGTAEAAWKRGRTP